MTSDDGVDSIPDHWKLEGRQGYFLLDWSSRKNPILIL
jgi:hypothetical protein